MIKYTSSFVTSIMLFAWSLFLLLISTVTHVSGQQSTNGIATIINNSHLSTAQVGISIRGINNDTYIGYQDHARMTSASTIKLITTLAAMENLGDSYQYRTAIGYRGTIQKDTLLGDMIIEASGDPTLGTHRTSLGHTIDEVADMIRTLLDQAGIACIDGDLVVDIGSFAGQGVSSKWLWEDLGNYYGSGTFPMNIHENTVFIRFGNTANPSSSTHVRSIEPSIKGLTYDNHVLTSTANGRDLAYVYGAPHQYNRSIRGSIPVRENGFKIKGSMPYPPRDAGWILRDKLADRYSSGTVRVVHNSPRYTKIGEITSPRLTEIARLCNEKSINLYADALLLSLGKKNGEWSFDGGKKALTESLKSIGLSQDAFSIEDGSGLSPFTSISPKEMTTALAYYLSKHPEWIDLIPRVHPDSPVKNLLRKDQIAGKLYLKSGSMSGVLGYAGVYYSPKGNSFAIHVATNHYAGSYTKTRKVLEKILQEYVLNLE